MIVGAAQRRSDTRMLRGGEIGWPVQGANGSPTPPIKLRTTGHGTGGEGRASTDFPITPPVMQTVGRIHDKANCVVRPPQPPRPDYQTWSQGPHSQHVVLATALAKLGGRKPKMAAKSSNFSRSRSPYTTPPGSPAHNSARVGGGRSAFRSSRSPEVIDLDGMAQVKRKRKRSTTDRASVSSSPSSLGGSVSPQVALEAPVVPVVENGEQQPVQCQHCFKKYRQHNSYFKHLYEHHPFWSDVASEYQLSKHGQVMLMQTAEVLLSFREPDVYGTIPSVRF